MCLHIMHTAAKIHNYFKHTIFFNCFVTNFHHFKCLMAPITNQRSEYRKEGVPIYKTTICDSIFWHTLYNSLYDRDVIYLPLNTTFFPSTMYTPFPGFCIFIPLRL